MCVVCSNARETVVNPQRGKYIVTCTTVVVVKQLTKIGVNTEKEMEMESELKARVWLWHSVHQLRP